MHIYFLHFADQTIMKSISNKSTWTQFQLRYYKAYPEIPNQQSQLKCAKLWKEIKSGEKRLDEETARLDAMCLKRKGQLFSFWSNVPEKGKRSASEIIDTKTTTSLKEEAPSTDPSRPNENDVPTTSSEPVKLITPAQDKLLETITNLKKQEEALRSLSSTGMSSVNKETIRKVKEKREVSENKLKRLKKENLRHQKRRKDLRENIKKVVEEHPDTEPMLKSFARESTGRPRIDADQPLLLSTIVDLVQASGATDDRRQTEILRTVKTLDDLVDGLGQQGIKISRSATYLRLLPRRGNTLEGKRHVQTVPIKLLRPENSLRKRNIDRMFAKSMVDDLNEICQLFGRQNVTFMSNDDKARIPLGLAAASLQAPIMMHLEYKVRLPDHDFVVGARHKLIPSVYAECEVREDGNVNYSGATFVRIRSGKHDTSNAYTHAYDMHEIFETGKVKRKPILLIETDGAQDEAPRYPKPLACAVHLFRFLKLDAFVHVVNAAGLSAFNPVERRMAPLSHDVAGIILPHDTYGTHLDKNGYTTNIELEQQNFQAASEVLADVWSHTVIDGHPVHATAVPTGKQLIPKEPDQVWMAAHVLQSRYALQIVKCLNETCCGSFETKWPDFFPKRFLPAPVVSHFGPKGLCVLEKEVYLKAPNNYQFASLQNRLLLNVNINLFDSYCLSMQEQLAKGICPHCDHYWPCAAAVTRHKVIHRNPPPVINVQEEESESDNSVESIQQQTEPQPMPVRNIFDLFLEGGAFEDA